MAEPGNGNGRAGIAANVTGLLRRLDPAFLGILVIDIVFMVSVIYLLAEQNSSRERVLGPLMQACISSIPLDALRELRPPDGGAGLQGEISGVRQELAGNRDGIRELGRQIGDLGRQIDPLRAAIDGLRPEIGTLRNDLTRDTRARLQGPTR